MDFPRARAELQRGVEERTVDQAGQMGVTQLQTFGG